MITIVSRKTFCYDGIKSSLGSKKMSTRFEQILIEALQLSPAERIRMIERLAASFGDTSPAGEENEPLSERELAELMRVEPLAPADIAAYSLLGTWSDQGISDGAEWVNEQKRKRKKQRKW
jgi:hypothetical protein